MAEIVSQVLIHLGTILVEDLKQHGKLVRDVEKDVKKLASTFRAIESLLLDAEERQLNDKSVDDWLTKLKNLSYEVDDVVDEWRTQLLKRRIEGDHDPDHQDRDHQHHFLKRVCCRFLPSSCCWYPSEIGMRHDMGVKIRELNERLDELATEKDRYNFASREAISRSLQTSPNINLSDVKGREKETSNLRRKLLEDRPGFQSISIQGTGGLGKTTLAKLVYNDRAVEAHFDYKIWVCVSDTFDQSTVAKIILESLTGSAPQLVGLSNTLEQIRRRIEGKKFLLVLDDVWEDSRSKWEELRNCVTRFAREQDLGDYAERRGFSRIGLRRCECNPSGEDARGVVCNAILTQVAFHGWSSEETEQVQDAIEAVVKKCHGSPLAAKVLGGILQSKKSNKDWLRLVNSELWRWEEARQDVFGPLALSYYDLPPAIRQCFQFCSIFPKDFEMEKNELIKMWMSQGFLRATDDQDMDEIEIGERYFQTLRMRSFFQDFEKMEIISVGEKTYCKMHDLVHDFARLTSKNGCICMTRGEVENLATLAAPSAIPSRIRHLKVQSLGGAPVSVSTLFSAMNLDNGLRSFMASNVDAAKPEIYNHLRGVRLLVLKDLHLKEISSAINQLIHLRHLDLSYNEILMELPEEVCELCNLETLLLNRNVNLKKLPSGMGNKLVNLKHLENDEVPARLPKPVGRLAASLKTLTQFNIMKEDGNGCTTNIGDLEGMNQLQGSLYVKGLNRVTDCNEVKRAEFARKVYLTHLWLDFASITEEAATDEEEEQVLEAVRPSSTSLERLDVINYSGLTMFPTWLISLSSLTSLAFIGCPGVQRLPPLGALPSLQQLYLTRMVNVKKVGVEFLGLSNDNGNNIAFPKLRLLRLEYMTNWGEWEVPEEMSSSVIMPRLRRLELFSCFRLEKLPDVILRKTTLEVLEICYSGGLGSYRFKQREMVPTEVWDKISHIPNLIFDRIDIRTRFKSDIESIYRIDCSNSKQEAGEDGDSN